MPQILKSVGKNSSSVATSLLSRETEEAHDALEHHNQPTNWSQIMNILTTTVPSSAYQMYKLSLGDTPLVKAAPLPSASAQSAQIMMAGADRAKRVSFAELCQYKPGEDTFKESGKVSHNIIAHSELANAFRSIYAEALNSEPVYETYAIARDGLQFTGRIAFPYVAESGRVHTEYLVSVIMRGSYDKSIAPSGAYGTDTRVCANMDIFSGDGLWKARQTADMPKNVMERLRESAEGAKQVNCGMIEKYDPWADSPCPDMLFYSYLGILRGRGVITPTLFSKALNYWHAGTAARDAGQLDGSAAHGNRTLTSAFQAVTGSLHSIVPNTRGKFGISGAATMVTDAVAATGGGVEGVVIPEFKLEDFARFENI